MGWVLVASETGQAEFFENDFYLECCINAPVFFADGFLMGGYPFFHSADANTINCGKFCEGAGLYGY